MKVINYERYHKDIASFSGLTENRILEIGSSELLGHYAINEINGNVNTAQFKVVIEHTPTGTLVFGEETDTDIPYDLYYGVFIPMVADAMVLQDTQFSQSVEHLVEGDSQVWFKRENIKDIMTKRNYQKLYSKYRKLRTL